MTLYSRFVLVLFIMVSLAGCDGGSQSPNARAEIEALWRLAIMDMESLVGWELFDARRESPREVSIGVNRDLPGFRGHPLYVQCEDYRAGTGSSPRCSENGQIQFFVDYGSTMTNVMRAELDRRCGEFSTRCMAAIHGVGHRDWAGNIRLRDASVVLVTSGNRW